MEASLACTGCRLIYRTLSLNVLKEAKQLFFIHFQILGDGTNESSDLDQLLAHVEPKCERVQIGTVNLFGLLRTTVNHPAQATPQLPASVR